MDVPQAPVSAIFNLTGTFRAGNWGEGWSNIGLQARNDSVLKGHVNLPTILDLSVKARWLSDNDEWSTMPSVLERIAGRSKFGGVVV